MPTDVCGDSLQTNKFTHGSLFRCTRLHIEGNHPNKTWLNHQTSSDSPVILIYLRLFPSILSRSCHPSFTETTFENACLFKSGPIVMVLLHPTSQEHFHFLPEIRRETASSLQSFQWWIVSTVWETPMVHAGNSAPTEEVSTFQRDDQNGWKSRVFSPWKGRWGMKPPSDVSLLCNPYIKL